MAKQKRADPARVAVEVEAGAESERWGYGFERHGAKWRAYRMGPELEYLTPERGEELHSAVARIQQALSKEIGLALHPRKGAA